MSLSDASDATGAPGAPRASSSPAKPESPEQERWGTVFMGPDKARESRMDKLLNQQERDLWSRGTEIEYLRRVREKATAEARTILDKAHVDGEALHRDASVWVKELKAQAEAVYAQARQEQARAEALRAEAEQIRAQAQAEGRQNGFEAVRLEVLEHEERRDAAASAVLHRIQEQIDVLSAAWRNELTALVRQAVQTATGWVMSEERAQGLEQLLAQSVQALESRQFFTAYVSPEDEDLVRTLLGKAQEHLGLSRWAVLADPGIAAGGLRLESDSGRVEDYADTRRVLVEDALSRLELPPSACDTQIHDAVNAPLAEFEDLPDFVPPSAKPVDPSVFSPTIPPEIFVPDVSPDVPPDISVQIPKDAPSATALEYHAGGADAPVFEPDGAHAADAAFTLVDEGEGADVDAVVDLDEELLPAVISYIPGNEPDIDGLSPDELDLGESDPDGLGRGEVREDGDSHA